METQSAEKPEGDHPSATTAAASRRRYLRRAFKWIAGFTAIYLLLAYLVMPLVWLHYEHQPAMASAPKTTETRTDIPGDPLNVGFVGDEVELLTALRAANWHPADKITWKSSLEIAGSVVFNRPYLDAPVSSLYLFGRKQDLAFEYPAGKSARKRHHVRLWRADRLGPEHHPYWIGAATFDESVGVSHYTGQITHHISPDVDAERDKLLGDIERAGYLTEIYQVTGVGPTLQGRNGGGDWYYTDGEVSIGVLRKTTAEPAKAVKRLANPTVVHWKNRAWRWLRRYLP